MGLSQFEKINEFINIKKEMFQFFERSIKKYNFIDFFEYETPWFVDLICESEEERDGAKAFLGDANILTRESYPALSKQSFLQNVEKTNLEVSENISEHILWLPSSTNLTKDQMQEVVDKVTTFCATKEF